MILLILLIPLLIANNSNGDMNVPTIKNKLWANIERQLEELGKKQELQKTRINGLKGLLREEGINFTQSTILNDESDNDPFGYAIISNLRSDFHLLKSYYSEVKTIDEFSDSIKNLSKEYCTNKPIYNFIPATSNEFRFKVRAPANLHIALAHRPLELLPMYEIVIGGWGNKKSVIRKDRKVELVAISHGTLLSECDFLGFWVRWSDNVIRVGYETDVDPFMQYNATDLFKVNYIGFQTFDKIGHWMIN